MGNFEPGSVVPETGTYVCGFCGMGDAFAGMLTGVAPDLEGLSKQERTTRFFKKGDRFDKCPSCGPGTGWNLHESRMEMANSSQETVENTKQAIVPTKKPGTSVWNDLGLEGFPTKAWGTAFVMFVSLMLLFYCRDNWNIAVPEVLINIVGIAMFLSFLLPAPAMIKHEFKKTSGQVSFRIKCITLSIETEPKGALVKRAWTEFFKVCSIELSRPQRGWHDHSFPCPVCASPVKIRVLSDALIITITKIGFGVSVAVLVLGFLPFWPSEVRGYTGLMFFVFGAFLLFLSERPRGWMVSSSSDRRHSVVDSSCTKESPKDC